MSLFRKPKKIQRRVFSSNADEDEDVSAVDIHGELETPPPPPPIISSGKRDKDKIKKTIRQSDDSGAISGGVAVQQKPKALLSFADDEDDGEVFQVRKSSHSKKVMRMLDKERRKKKREERAEITGHSGHFGYENGGNTQHLESSSATSDLASVSSSASGSGAAGSANLSSRYKCTSIASDNASVQSKSKKCDNDMIQTEIRTDDFVVSLWSRSRKLQMCY
ncbi:uncharacterized protein LOC108651045 isoform X3 [Drosophila navojoa]|uniref:uncharacterized protein LOC108651045 isoform X3 n=1 Tax=Drosophila navojoa TaxID=7232 RepID=UPI0011BE6561|nr:uncharacterized protein LOC108651045 isoform X3 [Drosophila navojoa]